MASVNTAVRPDKESVYFQGSLTQMQTRQFSNINRDNITFMDIVKNEPRKQSYIDTTEFDARLRKFTFLSNKFIYKKVIDDARVIPEDIIMKNNMDEYFSPRFYKNIHRLYQNSPIYFDYIFSSDGIAEQRHKQYSVYIYTLCLIEYIMKHYDSNEFKLIKDHQLYYEWALPKYSEQVSYIIKGPLSKSSTIKVDFKKHYTSIMNPSNIEGDITQFLQLTSLQNLDARLSQFFLLMSKMNNAYDKLKDEARTYNLVIRARNTKCYNDPLLNNTFIIDLRGSDFGETDYALASTASLDTVVGSSFDVSSRLTLHRLQQLFTKYSRFRIVSLNVNRELYNIKLDTLDSVNVVIKGIDMSSRTVNIINSERSIDTALDSFNVPGTFTMASNNIVAFKPFIDVTTYDSDKVRVTDARLYLTNNGNPLSAKLFNIKVNRDILYNVVYDNEHQSINGQDVCLIRPVNYTRYNTLIPERFSIIASSNNTGTISFNSNITDRFIDSYENGTAIMLEPSPITYTYLTVNGVNPETITSSRYPTTANELKEILGIEDLKLTTLNIKLGDTVNVQLSESFTNMSPDSFTYPKILTALMRSAQVIDSFIDFTSAITNGNGVLKGNSDDGFTKGYFVIYHYRGDELLEVHSVTPSNLVLRDTGTLSITLGITTLIQQTLLCLNYGYINTDDVAMLYDSIPLTNIDIEKDDKLFVYYYSSDANIPLQAYKGVVKLDDSQTRLTADWFNSVLLFKDIHDTLHIAGKYEITPAFNMHIINYMDQSLFNITRYAPVLFSNHMHINKEAVLLNQIERLGYGNETLTLRNNASTLYSNIAFISWEYLTVLCDMYMKDIQYSDDLILGLENMDDIFNIQLEFS